MALYLHHVGTGGRDMEAIAVSNVADESSQRSCCLLEHVVPELLDVV